MYLHTVAVVRVLQVAGLFTVVDRIAQKYTVFKVDYAKKILGTES